MYRGDPSLAIPRCIVSRFHPWQWTSPSFTFHSQKFTAQILGVFRPLSPNGNDLYILGHGLNKCYFNPSWIWNCFHRWSCSLLQTTITNKNKDPSVTVSHQGALCLSLKKQLYVTFPFYIHAVVNFFIALVQIHWSIVVIISDGLFMLCAPYILS